MSPNPAVLTWPRPAPGGGGGEFAFLQSAANLATSTTYTFAGQNLGDADSTRVIAVAIASRQGSGPSTLSTVTVAGVGASLAAQNANNGNHASIWYAAVPTGTSGDIVATWPVTRSRCFIGVYRLAGGTVALHDAANSAADPATLDVDTVSGSGVIGSVYSNAFADNVFTWTGLTANAASDHRYSFASHETASAQTPRPISVNMSNDLNRAAVAASFSIT